MTTIRVKKESNYSVISNIPLNDERLSWEARGILSYLLSKPDDWTIKTTDLIKRGKAGKTKIWRILSELEEHGYLDRQKYNKEDGTFKWVQTVYEIPKK